MGLASVFRGMGMGSAVTCGLLFGAQGAFAASDEAWDAFRADVQDKCLAQGAQTLESPAIVVDPFGSESYGMALMTGMEKDTTNVRSVLCVYDKQSKAVQLSGPLDLATSVAPGRGTEARLAAGDRGTGAGRAAPFGGQCSEECEATLSLLDPADQRKVTGLPQVIAQTILEKPEPSGVADVDAVRDVALSFSELVAGTPSDELTAPGSTAVTGKQPCSVYYYGFLNEGAKLVGRHTCTVAQLEGGALLVEKTTGERLRAEIRPLSDGFSAFIGRNYLAEQEERAYDAANPTNAGNANFGNMVGMATQRGKRLYLFSSEQRGFEAEDPTFFQALVVGG